MNSQKYTSSQTEVEPFCKFDIAVFAQVRTEGSLLCMGKIITSSVTSIGIRKSRWRFIHYDHLNLTFIVFALTSFASTLRNKLKP